MKKRFEIESLSSLVEQVLECHPMARNCDRELIIRVLVSLKLVVRTASGVMIPYGNLEMLPSFESITRCRRKIQEEGRFLPCEEVGGLRKESEQAMREINKWYPSSDAPKRPQDGRLF